MRSTINDHGFTDEEIRPMAEAVHRYNQHSGIASTPEQDWQQAIKLLRVERWLLKGKKTYE